MAQQIINVGTVANDRTGDTWRNAMIKSNDNFTELYGAVGADTAVFVAQESDFPVQDTTTITLEAQTVYILTADITTAKRFIVQDGAVLTARNVDGPELVYTGNLFMFSGQNTAFYMSHITISCPSATVFSWPNTAPTGRFELNTVEVTACNKIGEFTDTFSVILNNCLFASAAQGFEFFGTSNQFWVFRQSVIIGTSPTFIGFNLGSAVAIILDWGNILVQGPSGSIGISGLASNGNVPVSRIGRVQNSEFFPPLAPLNGITEDDTRWFFFVSPPIKNTHPTALLTLRNNATATVISVVNTPVLVAGTWVVNRTSQFTGTAGGRATYNAETTVESSIDIEGGLISASGSAIDVTLYLAVNGTVITASGIQVQISGSNAQTVTIPWELNIAQNDYLEVYVENNTNTTNIIVEHATLRIA